MSMNRHKSQTSPTDSMKGTLSHYDCWETSFCYKSKENNTVCSTHRDMDLDTAVSYHLSLWFNYVMQI